MLNALRRSAAGKRAAENLSAAIVTQARRPEFFRDLGVADTFDGRFDMVALHGWLVLERLEAEGARAVSQALINALFFGFEDALREQGAGDIGMGRRMKKMADAFYGRLKAYGETADRRGLVEAILRNVYRGEAGHEEAALCLADYGLAVRNRLSDSGVAVGNVDFGSLPAVTNR